MIVFHIVVYLSRKCTQGDVSAPPSELHKKKKKNPFSDSVMYTEIFFFLQTVLLNMIVADVFEMQFYLNNQSLHFDSSRKKQHSLFWLATLCRFYLKQVI